MFSEKSGLHQSSAFNIEHDDLLEYQYLISEVIIGEDVPWRAVVMHGGVLVL